MIPFPQIARWLSFEVDPVSIEDWMANREIFGANEKPDENEKEAEIAFQIENEKESDASKAGIYECEGRLLICARGKAGRKGIKVEWSVGKDKNHKNFLKPGEFAAFSPENGELAKIKVSCLEGFKIGDKSEFLFEGNDRKRVVVEAVEIKK